ncbi:unnamed protein product [Somion occarium]
MVRHLQHSQRELNISDKEVERVTIAGLVHDLGHGPWSHVWDSLFIPKALPDSTWKHEDASEMMFDDLIATNNLSHSIDDTARTLIKDLIRGRRDENKAAKPFLFDIVANNRNGLDVDKFDYIARDTRAVDDRTFTSVSRLIHSARVIDDQICYDIKDANQVYELCYTRFSLHKRIYNHKTAKAIEYMIVDTLLAAEQHMKIAERIRDPKRYVYLTESILTEIQASTAPELEKARKICDRIASRDLYKSVDYKVFPWAHMSQCSDYFTPENIVQAAKNLKVPDDDRVEDKIVAELGPEHVIVDLAPMHYGMGDKNPLDSVKFYSKRNPKSCRAAEPGDISLLMPAVFGEVMLRVYTRESRFFGLVQAGYRECLKQFNPEGMSQSTDGTKTPILDSGTAASSSSSVASLSTRWQDNKFTTVGINFQPPSPGKGTKRGLGREGSGGSAKKRAVSHGTSTFKLSTL